jgi:transitional endoplasmic reticulum ATPase
VRLSGNLSVMSDKLLGNLAVPIGFAWLFLIAEGLWCVTFGRQYAFSFAISTISVEDFPIRLIAAWTILLLLLRGIAVLFRSGGIEAAVAVFSLINFLGASICYGFYLGGQGTNWHVHVVFGAFILISLPFMWPFLDMAWGFVTGGMRQKVSSGPASAAHPAIARVRVPTIRFADIYGNEAIKARLKEAAAAITAPKKDSSSRATRNGILLHGGPGNGKTAFAEALAGELQLPLLQLSHSDVASMWVGERTSRIKQAFDQAIRNQPCVLFVDEVDSFLESRSGDRNDGTKEDRDAVNALLTLMVDIRQARVVLIAATNHIDRLDGAGVREGRFDFKCEITPPDGPARSGLLRKGLATNLPNMKVDDPVIEAVARRWNGFSVKRILAVTEELPAYVAREGKDKLEFEDFMGALRTIQGQRGATPENVKSLDELVLSEDTRDALQQIVGRMRDPEHTERHGGTLPTGVLFYGPPGTGKTATCKAVAKAVDWAFLPATGADLARNPKELDKLFDKAKELRPTIVFIDEADELLRSREFSGSTEATNKLLTLMDGVADRVRDVVWIAVTNNPEQIDPALLRGGRFTEKVRFDPPSAAQLSAHLDRWFGARGVKLDEGLSTATVVELIGSASIATGEAIVQAAVNRAVAKGEIPVVVRAADLERAAQLVLG